MQEGTRSVEEAEHAGFDCKQRHTSNLDTTRDVAHRLQPVEGLFRSSSSISTSTYESSASRALRPCFPPRVSSSILLLTRNRFSPTPFTRRRARLDAFLACVDVGARSPGSRGGEGLDKSAYWMCCSICEGRRARDQTRSPCEVRLRQIAHHWLIVEDHVFVSAY